MSQDYYMRFKKEDLILRDYLAADRTVLANERTFMAYIRTCVALAAAGASLIHFFDSPESTVLGIVLLVLSAVVLGFGLQRFIHYQRHLKKLQLGDWHEQIQWVKPGEGI